MPNVPARGSSLICGISPTYTVEGEPQPRKITVDDTYDPPRLIIELPDRALRNVGVVSLGSSTLVIGIADEGIPAYTEAFAYVSGTSKVEYHGWAAPGSAKGSLLWAIQKITYSGDDVTDIQWADGVRTFTKEWDERTTYTYS